MRPFRAGLCWLIERTAPTCAKNTDVSSHTGLLLEFLLILVLSIVDFSTLIL
jgi:hypothetical protein